MVFLRTRQASWRPLRAMLRPTRRGPHPDRSNRREPLARKPLIAARARRRSCGISGAGMSPRNIRRTGQRAARFTRRTPRRNAPTVASPEGGGTSASWLAAFIAQMRIFVSALPVSASARVARKWWNSAGSAGSAVNPFAAANCGQSRRAGTYRSHVGPALPATRMAIRDAGGGGAAGLAVPAHRACPARCVCLVCFSCRGCSDRRRITAATPRRAGRGARARGVQRLLQSRRNAIA